MRIAMIGTGYVGLVSGACFAEFGVEVSCVDKDPAKIAKLERGEIPIFEPGLDLLVDKHRREGRLSFTTELDEAIQNVDAVFIAVGTPSRRGDGHADLTYVFAAAEEIAQKLTDRAVLVTKSTVPVGTGRKIVELVRKKRPDLEIDVASNPEFLREGSAIEDFLRPDRVVCGVESDHARAVLEECYRPLYINETPMVFTNIETSELTKYAANAFLATKITYINEMAELCEKVGANVADVAKGMGLDGRIGRRFLHAGPGYGGSCFPKDTLALLRTGEEYDVPLKIVDAVVQVNDQRKRSMVRKIVRACGGSVAGKTIAVLGVTFKPNTDDMRDSPSLVILPALQADGAKVKAHDPEGMREGEALLPDVHWASDAYDAMTDADAVVLMTEWNVFRALDLDRAKELMKHPVMIDLRNVYDPVAMNKAGFAYTSVGRPQAAA